MSQLNDEVVVVFGTANVAKVNVDMTVGFGVSVVIAKVAGISKAGFVTVAHVNVNSSVVVGITVTSDCEGVTEINVVVRAGFLDGTDAVVGIRVVNDVGTVSAPGDGAGAGADGHPRPYFLQHQSILSEDHLITSISHL